MQGMPARAAVRLWQGVQAVLRRSGFGLLAFQVGRQQLVDNRPGGAIWRILSTAWG